jgi:DNA-binding NarL/FixJ family response regulator
VQAIREVVSGQTYLSERVRSALLATNGDGGVAAEKQASLSEREQLVLQWLGEGDSGEEMARRLHISSRTIETYCVRIMAKFGLEGMRELRRYAIQCGHEALAHRNATPE